MQQKERQEQNTIVHRCIWLSIARFKQAAEQQTTVSLDYHMRAVRSFALHFLFSVNCFDYRLSNLCITLKMFLPTQF